jgi:hypothetical protein
MKLQPTTSRLLASLLAFSISGYADLAQAAQIPSPQQSATQQQGTAPPATQSAPTTPDSTTQTAPATPDSTLPATPAELPNAPSANATPAQAAPSQDQSSSSSSSSSSRQDQNGASTQQLQQQQQQPLGAAAAQKGVTRGGAASKPAGTAFAGTKQRQSRSLLIKLGAVAAAGVALGTIYALTRGTSSTPPGAR